MLQFSNVLLLSQDLTRRGSFSTALVRWSLTYVKLGLSAPHYGWFGQIRGCWNMLIAVNWHYAVLQHHILYEQCITFLLALRRMRCEAPFLELFHSLLYLFVPAQWCSGGCLLPSPVLLDLRLSSLWEVHAPHASRWIEAPAHTDQSSKCCAVSVVLTAGNHVHFVTVAGLFIFSFTWNIKDAWQNLQSENWAPNTMSCYATVYNRHFSSSDFKEVCKIGSLKKDTVPSIFEEYPAYLQPPKKERETTHQWKSAMPLR